MKRDEFINKIFLRYPPVIAKGDSIENMYSDMSAALDDGHEYNYDEAFIDLMRSYSFKSTPPAKIVYECLKHFEIKSNPKAGSLRIWQKTATGKKNGIIYEFAIPQGSTEAEARYYLARRGLTDINIKGK